MEDGRAFEDKVKRLLELRGYAVQTETLLGSKKVDLIFTYPFLGGPKNVCVECKCHSRKLDRRELSIIKAEYDPLYESGAMDELLIVTLNRLTPSGQAMISECRHIRHLTISDLQSGVISFDRYLADLERAYHADGLNNYYVKLLTSAGTDLESEVMDWIEGGSDQPLAILGSYGMGKTTFAKRLAYVLANAHRENREGRIPILVRLGEIAQEQDLEGLLGKTLTTDSIAGHYSFHAFMELNSIGQFVVILDGFDEMKHTLTWDEFRYNFTQLNRLVVPRSRVVILGRPTAFITDSEHMHALHGIRMVGDQVITEPDWPDYREIEIALFSKTEVAEFLTRYLQYKSSISDSSKEKRRLARLVDQDVIALSGKRFTDMARRPVQLKMLADILPQWDGDTAELTVTLLYSLFIDMIITRELDKRSRRNIPLTVRRSFASDLAYWLWCNKREMSLAADCVPPSLLRKYCREGEDVEPVKRDLVSACFLERKLGGTLYFPHRSFQEFLVAEHLVEGLSNGTVSFPDADAALTSEIASFMVGMVNIGVFMKWEKQLSQHRGVLSQSLARAWMNPDYLPYLIDSMASANPWHALLAARLAVLAHDSIAPVHIQNMCQVLLKLQQKEMDDGRFALLCHLCIAIVSPGSLVRSSLINLMRSGRTTKEKASGRDHRQVTRVFVPHKEVVEFLNEIYGSRIQGKPCFELDECYSILLQQLEGYCLIGDWNISEVVAQKDTQVVSDPELHGRLVHYLQKYGDGYSDGPKFASLTIGRGEEN